MSFFAILSRSNPRPYTLKYLPTSIKTSFFAVLSRCSSAKLFACRFVIFNLREIPIYMYTYIYTHTHTHTHKHTHAQKHTHIGHHQLGCHMTYPGEGVGFVV